MRITEIATRYDDSKPQVREQMEKEIKQRIKFAMKYSDEFDLE